jgi:hypothetical protein
MKPIKAQSFFKRKMLCLSLCLIAVAGCTQLSSEKPPGPWHTAYQPINDATSQQFIQTALAEATKQFGAPVIPVKKVLLRRSKKSSTAKGYRVAEDFSLTECVDPTNGIFAIYLAVDPSHPDYFPLLGHECTHLINANIFDWYMEGIATRFSEQICAKTGKPWSNWTKRFGKNKRDPYALSYRMMHELQTQFPAEYPRIVQHIGLGENGHLRVDIDGWLCTLSASQRTQALKIITPYIKLLIHHTGVGYNFTVPAAL